MKTIKKKLIFIMLTLLIVISAVYIVVSNTVERKIYRDLKIDVPFSELNITEKYNSYGGDILGDGESLHVIKSKLNLYDSVKSWKTLPLEKNIRNLLYDDFDDSHTDEIGLPVIKDGKYKVINRGDPENFGRSYNLTIYIYDKKNNEMYCYQIDT